MFGSPFVADATLAARVSGDASVVNATPAAPVGGDGVHGSMKPPWVLYFTNCSVGVATTGTVSLVAFGCSHNVLRGWCVCGNFMCSDDTSLCGILLYGVERSAMVWWVSTS